MSNVNQEIDNKILIIEKKLENIFDKYRDNGIFEKLTPTAFIYKNTIRFVPIELKEEVEQLLNILATLEQRKVKITSRSR